MIRSKSKHLCGASLSATHTCLQKNPSPPPSTTRSLLPYYKGLTSTKEKKRSSWGSRNRAQIVVRRLTIGPKDRLLFDERLCRTKNHITAILQALLYHSASTAHKSEVGLRPYDEVISTHLLACEFSRQLYDQLRGDRINEDAELRQR
jgi:hypothetical protein